MLGDHAGPGAHRTRAEESADSALIATHKKISQLEARVKEREGQSDRLTPLGYDRCWNRFWILGAQLPGGSGVFPMHLQAKGSAFQRFKAGHAVLYGDCSSADCLCTQMDHHLQLLHLLRLKSSCSI